MESAISSLMAKVEIVCRLESRKKFVLTACTDDIARADNTTITAN